MLPFQHTIALARLECVGSQADTTPRAIRLLEQGLTTSQLLRRLGTYRHSAPAALALCALQSPAPAVWQAVRASLATNAGLAWGFVEALNVLPWLGGMRAFLTLTDKPAQSKYANPFYILTRNKIFYPTDMAGPVYAYHVQGLWDLVDTAKRAQWPRITPAALAVVNQLRCRLEQCNPDPFAVKLATLLFGEIGSQSAAQQRLRERKRQACHSLVRSTAALTLNHLTQHPSPALSA